jgi:transcriptional regulator with XRE-family HTH domain
MRITPEMTSQEIMVELGGRIRTCRLQSDRALEEVAESAGIGLRTASRVEAGENPTLLTVIRMLRALGRLDALDQFLPRPTVSPIALAALAGRVRKRAGRRRSGLSDGEE